MSEENKKEKTKDDDMMYYQFVDFTFGIPAKGKDNRELVEYALNRLAEEGWEYIKDILRSGGEFAIFGDEISLAEVPDYFCEEE